MNKWISVDIEADGPAPGLYSMIEIGAVYIDPEGKLDQTFYGGLRPLDKADFSIDAMNAIGVGRREVMKFNLPENTMYDFYDWLMKLKIMKGNGLCMISDNAGFDWMFINWYFWKYLHKNPFGYSCTSLTSLYKGFEKDIRANFKHLRKTKHTHNPVDDAKGNAEALVYLIKKDLKLKLG